MLYGGEYSEREVGWRRMSKVIYMIYLVAIILALITIGIYGIYVYFDERKRMKNNEYRNK